MFNKSDRWKDISTSGFSTCFFLRARSHWAGLLSNNSFSDRAGVDEGIGKGLNQKAEYAVDLHALLQQLKLMDVKPWYMDELLIWKRICKVYQQDGCGHVNHIITWVTRKWEINTVVKVIWQNQMILTRRLLKVKNVIVTLICQSVCRFLCRQSN